MVGEVEQSVDRQEQALAADSLGLLLVWLDPAQRDMVARRLVRDTPGVHVAYAGACTEEAARSARDVGSCLAVVGGSDDGQSDDAVDIGPLLRVGVPVVGLTTRDLAIAQMAIRNAADQSPATNGAAASARIRLGNREFEAARLYGDGMTLKQVAAAMGISFSTAATYIKRVRQKYERAGTPLRNKVDFHRAMQAQSQSNVIPFAG